MDNADLVHGVTIAGGWFEANVFRGNLRLLIQTVSQTTDNAQDLNLPGGGEADLQRYVALDLQSPCLGSICWQRLIQHNNWRPGRIDLLDHMLSAGGLLTAKTCLHNFAVAVSPSRSALYSTGKPS